MKIFCEELGFFFLQFEHFDFSFSLNFETHFVWRPVPQHATHTTLTVPLTSSDASGRRLLHNQQSGEVNVSMKTFRKKIGKTKIHKIS